MTSFVHTEYPLTHPGVERAERVASMVATAVRRVNGTRATAVLLLSAVVSALMVAANEVIDTWTEGHLLAAWLVLWTVAFAALALLAGPMQSSSQRLRGAWLRWTARRKQAALDQQLWNAAQSDARIMADISRAMSAESDAYPRRAA